MIVRRYEPGEEEEIWDIYAGTTRKINSRDYTPAQIARWAPDDHDCAAWNEKLARSNPFVAVENGRLVGFAELETDGHIDNFYCHHEWQRRGVGAALLGRIEAEAASQGIAALYAEVSVTAEPFFTAMGFGIERERVRVICGAPAKQFIMRKSLGAPPQSIQSAMPEIPVLRSRRLTLRPFTRADAPAVQRLAGVAEIARTTLAIPYPYPDGLAEEWIRSHKGRFAGGASLDLAIELDSAQELVGAIGLRLEQEHRRAELGYWIGRPYWSQGYATEAAGMLVAYGFDDLGLERVYAYHFTNNPASGRVLEKTGMKREGLRRQHTFRDGVFLDSVLYGLLREDTDRKSRGTPYSIP